MSMNHVLAQIYHQRAKMTKIPFLHIRDWNASIEGHKFHSAMQFGFTSSNNKAEYKALLTGLRLAKNIQVKAISIYNDSLLIVNQISREYQAHDFKMMAYLSKVKDSLAQFDRYSIQQVPRDKNSNADALAKLASAKDVESLDIIPVEHLSNPSIKEDDSTIIQASDTWMTPIIKYLEDETLPSDKNEAKMLRRQAARFLLLEEILYQRGHSMPLLWSVPKDKSKLLLEEVHEGFCGDHAGGRA